MTDETQNESASAGKAKRNDADHDALLAHYGFGDLPVTFAMRNGDGSVIQEKNPCYQCMTDGFYGRGVAGTFYQEGDIIVADIVPNEWLQPLNRAAAIKFIAWKQTLPQDSVPIDIGDLSEAAQMLAKDPNVTLLPPDSYQKALRDLSMRLKVKRLGKDAMEIPSLAHNFSPASGGKSPPIVGARLSEMAQRGPGFNSLPNTAHPPGGVRRANPNPAALGGNPQR
jgi:hypothetical protein